MINLKKYIPYSLILICIFVGMQFIKCNQDLNLHDKTQVNQNITLKPVDKKDEIYIPKGSKAIGELQNITDTSDPSKIKTIKTIIHSDANCNTCNVKATQIIETKVKIGLVNEPKVALLYLDSQIVPAYAHSFFRLNKATTELIVTLGNIGLGEGYQVTNNTFVGLGLTAKIFNYENIYKLSSYNISSTIQAYPTIYIGFRF